MDKIVFTDEATGEEDAFYIIEQTVLNGASYLLAAEEEGAEEFFLLKECRTEGDDVYYEEVEDETEAEAVLGVFEELLDDEEIW